VEFEKCWKHVYRRQLGVIPASSRGFSCGGQKKTANSSPSGVAPLPRPGWPGATDTRYDLWGELIDTGSLAGNVSSSASSSSLSLSSSFAGLFFRVGSLPLSGEIGSLAGNVSSMASSSTS